MNRRTALVFGAEGLLGRELAPSLEQAGWHVHRVGRDVCDITQTAAVSLVVGRYQPEIIVNCAAYTHVDKAEQESELAFAVNAVGAGIVARAAAHAQAILVHLSTDYAFDGNHSAPYLETDHPFPLGVYAKSKVAGEAAVAESGARTYLVRTGELYGDGGRNFFHAILARARAGSPLRVIRDQVVSPTWTRELARQLALLIDGAEPGVYHATSDGHATWFEAAQEILRLSGLTAAIEPVSTEEYGSPTPRPRYSVLSHQKLTNLGLYQMRPWQEALAEWVAVAAP